MNIIVWSGPGWYTREIGIITRVSDEIIREYGCELEEYCAKHWRGKPYFYWMRPADSETLEVLPKEDA